MIYFILGISITINLFVIACIIFFYEQKKSLKKDKWNFKNDEIGEFWK